MRLVETALDLDDRVGDYRIVARGPDRQYRAEHLNTGARVVLDVRDNEDWRLVAVQFVRAQTTLAAAPHPGIAPIVAHGVLGRDTVCLPAVARRAPTAPPPPRPWAASALADGNALGEVLARGKLVVGACTALVRDIASVLAHAHAHGFVHGNLRPSRIIIVAGARSFPLSIGDWTSLRAPGIPAFGDPPATNVYVAPEHRFGAIDGRADVYALGAIAYRALTGVFHDVERDRLGAAEGVLGSLVLAMLERDPVLRPTAAEVVAACDSIVTSARDTAPPGPRARWTPSPDALSAARPPHTVPPRLSKPRSR